MYIFINLCITTRWLGIFAMQTADEVFNFEELMCHVEADRSSCHRNQNISGGHVFISS